jgi:hypothetical protein
MSGPSSSSTPSTGQRRWWLWLPLLAVSAWLAFQQPTPTATDIVQPRARAQDPRTLPRDPIGADEPLLALQDRQQWPLTRPDQEQPTTDLFARRSWTPPPKPVAAVKPPPPPPPMAPPLPFSFLGKKSEAGAWEVYLARGDLSYIVREGTTFAEVYRVEHVKPPEMTLIYLPLEQTQVMNIGVAQ